MSDSSPTRSRPKSRHSAPTERPVFPVWAPPLVMIAVTVTGVVLAWEKGSASLAFFILFALACVICTILVEFRGLFFTVVAQPIYYVVGTVFIGWITAGKATGGMKTKLLTSAYPTVEHFLWLAAAVVASIIIAIIRWRMFRSKSQRRYQQETSARTRRRTADTENRETYTRARAAREARQAHSKQVERDTRERDTRERDSRERDSRDRDTRASRADERPEEGHRRTVEELMRNAEKRRAAREDRESRESHTSHRRYARSPLPSSASPSREREVYTPHRREWDDRRYSESERGDRRDNDRSTGQSHESERQSRSRSGRERHKLPRRTRRFPMRKKKPFEDSEFQLREDD